MNIKIEFKKKGGILIVRLVCKNISRITRKDSERCIDKILQRFGDGYQAMLLDIGNISYARTLLLGLFLWLHSEIEKKGKILVLIKASSFMKDVLKLLGLDKFLKTYSSTDKAIKSLTKILPPHKPAKTKKPKE